MSQGPQPYGSRDDILRFIIPQISAIHDNMPMLAPANANNQLAQRRAALNILNALKTGADFALDWAPRFAGPSPHVAYPDAAQVGLLSNIGEQLHNALEINGLKWPPPHPVPPPAVTRDLLELYNQAAAQTDEDLSEPLEARLSKAFSIIRMHATRLSYELQTRVSADDIETTRLLASGTGQQRAGGWKMWGAISLGGIALAADLFGIAGGISDLHSKDLHGPEQSATTISRQIAAGSVKVTEGIVFELGE